MLITKILLVLFIIVMTICLIGCDTDNKIAYGAAEDYVEDLGFAIIKQLSEHGDAYTYLVYDKETKVEYILVDVFCEKSLCPYYDENGEVVIYKGE